MEETIEKIKIKTRQYYRYGSLSSGKLVGIMNRALTWSGYGEMEMWRELALTRPQFAWRCVQGHKLLEVAHGT